MMKRILAPSLIALYVSTGALAQQATEEIETSAETLAVEAENTLEDAANDTQAAVNDMSEDRPLLNSPTDLSRDGYQSVDREELTADDLEDSNVYGTNDEEIGEIEELLLSEDGKTIERVVIEVGGFLGMGEREVAVTMEELHIMRSDDGDEVRVYMDATEEQLEQQPEYDG